MPPTSTESQHPTKPDSSPSPGAVILVLIAASFAVGVIVTLVVFAGLRDRSGLEEPDPPEPVPIEVDPLMSLDPGRSMGVAEPETVEVESGPDPWQDFNETLFLVALSTVLEPDPEPEPEPEGEVSSQTAELPDIRPNPAPVPVPDEVRAVLCGPFAHECEVAVRVVRCESTFNAHAVGGEGERGWWQIHPVHIGRINELGYSWDDMFDPVANTAVAWNIRAEQGWRPWTCA